MKKLISTRNMGKTEWLCHRKRGIGGSDAGAVCGLNPYRSAMEVYLDKTTDDTEEFDNEAMRQGREFEDYVAKGSWKRSGRRSAGLAPCSMTKPTRGCAQTWTAW